MSGNMESETFEKYKLMKMGGDQNQRKPCHGDYWYFLLDTFYCAKTIVGDSIQSGKTCKVYSITGVAKLMVSSVEVNLPAADSV